MFNIITIVKFHSDSNMKEIKMRKFVGLILLVTLMLPLIGATEFNISNMNPQSQLHIAHISTGTVNLNCDICHGFPPVNTVQVQQNATSPGSYIVCESCHAPPPDSFKPSMGNLITIHLSRNTSCTNCHDTDNITPTHPSIRSENGILQVCKNCHVNPQDNTPHVNGGKYCLDCHGDRNATLKNAPVQTVPITNTAPISQVIIVKLDYSRGFFNLMQGTLKIKAGDEVIWTNDGTYPVTIVSVDNLFEPKFLDNGKRTSYIFKKPATYNFYLNENKNATGAIIVESLVSSTPSSTPASTIASISTVPVQTPKKRAQLQVTYEIGTGKTKQEPMVSVHLKNIGNATATKVNLTIDNPSELQVTVLSGSEQTGNTITWNGEIEPGKEHIAQYAVKIVAGRDIEVPLKVTYAKISQEDKARELGINSASSAEVNAAITPEEIELITLVMKITLSAIPGFEGITAIALVLSAGVILRKRGK